MYYQNKFLEVEPVLELMLEKVLMLKAGMILAISRIKH